MRFISTHRAMNPHLRTRVSVGYHMYNDNLGEELNRMASLTAELGFAFDPYLAYLPTLESIFEYLDGKHGEQVEQVTRRLIRGPQDYQRLLDRLERRSTDCRCREDMLVADVDGRVDLCCRSYLQSTGRSLPEDSFAEIQASKRLHPFCERCISSGWNALDAPEVVELIKREADRCNGRSIPDRRPHRLSSYSTRCTMKARAPHA